jgi:hypothetical protein
MCECDGISNDKIQVYKVIDDETTPNGIVHKNIDDVVTHFQSWVKNLSTGQEFDFKVISEEMTESQFENLPEFE